MTRQRLIVQKGQQMLVAIEPVSVSDWVEERLRGFAFRQQARKEKRAADRKRWAETPPEMKRKRVTSMRVVFRATFQELIGPLNPMHLNCSRITLDVEVFRKGDNWLARSKGNPMARIGRHPSHGVAKDAVARCFSSQVTPWVLCDTSGKPLDPDYVDEDPHGNFTMKTITHCAGPQQEKADNDYRTLCNQIVTAFHIVSLRGHTPPICKECRVHWDKMKPEERLP